MNKRIVMIFLLSCLSSSMLFGINWQTKAAMPTPRSFLGVATVGEKVYVVGGEDTNGEIDSLEVYDATADTWISSTSLPAAVSTFGIGVVGGKLYVIGGQTLFHSGWTAVNEEGTVVVGAAETDCCFSNETFKLMVQPNPFQNRTEIKIQPFYNLGDGVQTSTFKLEILSSNGRTVKRLTDACFSEKTIIPWDGTDEKGRSVPAGVYFVRISGENYRLTEKVVLIR